MTTGAEATEEVEPGRDLEGFYRDEFGRAGRLALLLVGDQHVAEEITMEAFMRVAARWSKVSSLEDPGAYLRRVVVNVATSRWRRLQVERRALGRLGGPEQVVWNVSGRGESAHVLDAVRLLPQRQRACVVLRYFEDLPEAEIAATLRCSLGTVKSQLSKARARLAQLLAAEGNDGDD